MLLRVRALTCQLAHDLAGIHNLVSTIPVDMSSVTPSIQCVEALPLYLSSGNELRKVLAATPQSLEQTLKPFDISSNDMKTMFNDLVVRLATCQNWIVNNTTPDAKESYTNLQQAYLKTTNQLNESQAETSRLQAELTIAKAATQRLQEEKKSALFDLDKYARHVTRMGIRLEELEASGPRPVSTTPEPQPTQTMPVEESVVDSDLKSIAETRLKEIERLEEERKSLLTSTNEVSFPLSFH